jgi:hypothetical protein
MNIGLMQQVKAAILAKPEKYDQDLFCGTECCIAGWALTIANPRLGEKIQTRQLDQDTWDSLWCKTRITLGLSGPQMALLCSCAEDWPADFREQYDAAKTDIERAMVGAARIDHFIATNGAE